MAVKYTRDGVRQNTNARWVVEGRAVHQTKRRNLAIFMGICVACLILLLYNNLAGKSANRWLPDRFSDAVITDKTEETQAGEIKYYVTVAVKVPPAIPKEKSLLTGDELEIEKKSAALELEDTVQVLKADWDTSSIGDQLRAFYIIKMQRDQVKVHDLARDFMEPEALDENSKVLKEPN